MNDISKKIEVFLPTHIVGYKCGKPLGHMKKTILMIEETIVNFHKMMSLEKCRFNIYLDKRFEKLCPEAYAAHVQSLGELTKKIRSKNIECYLAKENTNTLRGNWELFLNNTNCEYMLFLEHDWQLNQKIDIKKLLSLFENNKEINYLRLSKSSGSFFNSNWDLVSDESNRKIIIDSKELIIGEGSFFSGNPHIMKVSKASEILARLNTECKSGLGASFLEDDIQKLALNDLNLLRSNSCGHTSKDKNHVKKCLHCYRAAEKQHADWGIFILRNINDKSPIVFHSGEWVRKI